MYPHILEDKINIVEGSIIGCYWKDPTLFDEYPLKKEDFTDVGKMFYLVGENMYKLNNNVLDDLAIKSYFETNKGLKTIWDKYSGTSSIKEMMAVANLKNFEAYYDNFVKCQLLKKLHEKGFNIEKEWTRFEKMTSSGVFDFYEYQLNSITIDAISDLDFENLYLTDEELDDIMSGANLGLQFGKKAPILNNWCMGLPKSELNAICSYINEGKTSIAFENFIMPILNNGHKSLIISTEQKSIVFKMLLLIHVLTEHLNYWKLTRKKLKTGKYTEDDKAMIHKARQIIKEKYSENLIFLKMYDYNTDLVTKAIKKYSKVGLELVLYDVLKFDSSSDGAVWEKLITDSKNLFQCCSKYNVCGLVTLQLAMSTKNKVRRVGMECVANSKAIFEVMSECVFIRTLFDDERDEESKFYCNPYRLLRDEDGKFTNIKEEIKLDKDKHYKVLTLGKSRNDATGNFLLYEVDFNWNKWREVGYCTISDQNRY